MLGLCYTWALKGKPLRVKSRFPSKGGLNLIGAWVIFGNEAKLFYRELEGNCNSVQVLKFLEALILTRQKVNQLMTIVLDNASFHRAMIIREKAETWEKSNVFLRFIPAYCPELNYIENIWRKIKGFLMPRRYYNSVDELRAALLIALNTLGSVRL